jgi:hypothetical protein
MEEKEEQESKRKSQRASNHKLTEEGEINFND